MRPIVAQDLMTPEILGVRESQSVQEAAQYLIDESISGALVRDADGKITGVLTLTDIARAFVARENSGGTELETGDVMSSQIVAVDADAPADEVAEVLLESHIHRVLVRDGENFVGVITTSDLLGLLVQE